MNNLISIIIGIYFGIVLLKSEVASWFRIQAMFNFEESHMFLTIGSAVITGIAAIRTIHLFNLVHAKNKTIAVPNKKFNKGTIIGGVLFGIGWAITGSCPGPIYAQIGSGELVALSTLIGAVVGASIFEIFCPRLPV